MVAFNSVFTSVFLAIVYSSIASGASSEKFATHHARKVARGDEIETFHPETTFETFGEGLEQPASLTADLRGETVSFINTRLGDAAPEVVYHSGHETGENRFAYLKQVHNGIPFANAVANVAWRGNKVISFGASFVKPVEIAESTPSLSLEEVIPRTEEALGGKYNNHPAGLEYLARPDGTASLAHVFQVQNDANGLWVEAFVNAHTGELLSLTDFVSKATYHVVPIWKHALPDGMETLVNPEDLLASPLGWLNDGTTNSTGTSGNNAISLRNTQSSPTPSSGPDEFIYPYNPATAPTSQENGNCAAVNAFYVVNSVHDFAYRYGFTESAFNFQNNNFGKGGTGNDRVQITTQDPSGTISFVTPPDGQPGRCRLGLPNIAPVRDPALANDIIVHEVGHGITNRITGGGTGRCLQTTESMGLGEGWSDALASWTEHTSDAVPDYVLGAWLSNNAAGIRSKPYSVSTSINPLLYGNLATQTEIHGIGEIWANILHNMYAALVAQSGWSTTSRTNPTGTEGNVVFLHLFMDALFLQPCNPTFIHARDAWLQADINRYSGANRCVLWRVFASRGMGTGASSHINNFTIPADC